MKMYGPEIREPLVRCMMPPENASIQHGSGLTTWESRRQTSGGSHPGARYNAERSIRKVAAPPS